MKGERPDFTGQIPVACWKNISRETGKVYYKCKLGNFEFVMFPQQKQPKQEYSQPTMAPFEQVQ